MSDNVKAAIALGPGERLERAFVFDPVERGDVSFHLVLVTKRRADGRLEMTALGGRADGPGAFALEFARSARLPDELLPSILGELMERIESGGALYREIDLAGEGDPDDQIAGLLEKLGGSPDHREAP